VGRYEAVPGRSQVVIDARSSVHPIQVQTAVDGFLVVELDSDGRVVAGAPVAGDVSVDVADLRSGNPLVDRETRRRLDPRRYPRIVGSLTSLVPGAGASGAGVGVYEAEGTIDFYGAVRAVAGSVTLAVDGDEVTVEGRQRFDVRDWGLEPPQLLMLRVHPVVEVQLRMVLRRSE
jgi:hypothetical protein